MSINSSLHRRSLLAGAAALVGTTTMAARVRAADPTTIKFWAAFSPTDPDYKAAMTLIPAYEKAHPGMQTICKRSATTRCTTSWSRRSPAAMRPT